MLTLTQLKALLHRMMDAGMSREHAIELIRLSYSVDLGEHV